MDMLKPDSEGVGLWRKSVNGIGRQRGDFQIRISLEPSEKFDAGVAIDDLGKHMYIRVSKVVSDHKALMCFGGPVWSIKTHEVFGGEEHKWVHLNT